MATTVYSAFSIFNTDEVNLIPDRTKKGRSSRDWLISQLEKLPAKEEHFPNLYDGMHIRYGSFARNTKLRPLDDIDLIVTFSAEGTRHTILEYGKNYILTVPESATNLRKLCNENGQLNSIKVVNKLVKALGNIEQYKSSKIHRRQEAATLNLSSYEWNFDIVPAFYTDSNYYLIPDGAGNWKATDPRIDQQRTRDVNSLHNGKSLQIIRTLKYWNKRAQMPTIGSYLFENLVINYLNGRDSLNDITYEIWSFWDYLKTEIYNSVRDPKGFQGELNTLSYDDKNKISAKALETSNKAYDAIMFAPYEPEKAINKWREIFGGDFPKYG
jgi:hypothetical protein